MIMNNVMNPENIQAGDTVRITNARGGDPQCKMVVESVSGPYGNKVYCPKIGHELYAACFVLVSKGGK